MKKLILILFILLCALTSVFADEYVISKIECFDASDFYTEEISFKYDDSENVYYLCRSTYSSIYWFTLTPAKLDKLRANLKKAQDWSNLAKEKKSSITKELPDSKIRVEGTMKMGNDWYTSRWDIDIEFFFISKIDEENEVISLLLRGGEAESIQNQFMDIEFKSVAFITDKQIDAFVNAISSETIDAAKAKHKEEKEAADLFN